MKFHFKVEVEADSFEQALDVVTNRLGTDEDYGFEYTINWSPVGPRGSGDTTGEVRYR